MNYSEILSACTAYADRQDIEVDAALDLFVIMSESRMNRVLKTRKQSVRTTTPVFDVFEYYPLPVDYAGMRDIQINVPSATGGVGKTVPLTYISPISMNAKKGMDVGSKIYYSIIADQIQLYPPPAQGCSLELLYFQRVPNLTSDNPTNWMSDLNPDIYISGITAEIEIFAKNYEISKLWYERMSIAINELEESDEIERWSGSPLTIELVT